MRSDINGDSIPEVIAQEYSGGAHCCFTWHIFSAGPTLREIPLPTEGHAEHFGGFPLVDVNHDGKFELRMWDFTFAYWKTSFASSPATELFYVWRDGQYAFAPELMRRTPFLPEELEKMAQKLSWDNPANSESEGVPPEFWADLLVLIETGNVDQVDVFAEIGWPRNKAGKAPFLASFRERLRTSLHVAEFQILNGLHQ